MDGQRTVSASRRLLSDAPASMRLPSDADCFMLRGLAAASAAMPVRCAGPSTAPLPVQQTGRTSIYNYS